MVNEELSLLTPSDLDEAAKEYELEYVLYNGISYPIRTVRFWDMNVRIATKSLDRALFDEETSLPTSQESNAIDDTLFYFVEEEEIFLPQHELLQLLENQVA